jgi:hypothetical protein
MVNHRRRLKVSLTLVFLILVFILMPATWFQALAAGNPLVAGNPVVAGISQTAGIPLAVLSPPTIDKFPRITTYLDLRDENGVFLSGLLASQVSILEDDKPVPVLELNEIKPGAQFVLALNPGRSFAIRDATGKSRFDSLRQDLLDWAAARPGLATDDLSLITPESTLVTHNSDPKQLTAALQAYQLGVVPEIPDLNVLSSAVETVADNTPRYGMGRAILFITSLPSIDLTVGLKSLAGSASQQGVHISIWLVASPDQSNSPAVFQLQELAKQTHGQFFFYSGIETLPDIETLIQPVQDSYRLAYESKITTSAPHTLTAQIDLGGIKIKTPVLSFELNIQAPNPMFVSPPTEIMRETPADSHNPNVDLLPVKQPLDVLIEFPDGFIRPVVTSTLLVDGSPVATNLSAPFDKFTWDLSGYVINGNHQIRVEVVDALGLHGASRDLPVHITVRRTTQGVMMALYRNGPLLAGLAALLAGAILLLVLLLGGRIKPVAFGRGMQPGLKVRPAEKTIPHRRSDPVTQPVVDAHGESLARHKPAWMNRLQWPQRRISPKAFAYLTRLSEADQEQDSTPVPIEAEEITLGTDAVRSTLVIDDPSVEALHACLRREGDTYRLCDQGSVAGTWVNYTPVSSEGVLLEHADLVHIGRAGFRFTLRQPGKVRKPVVRPEAPKK